MEYTSDDSNETETGSPCDITSMNIAIKRKLSIDEELAKRIRLDTSEDLSLTTSSYNYETNWIIDYLGSVALSTHLNNLTIRRVQLSMIPVLTSLIQYKDNKDVFNSPVDAEEQGIPDYFDIIKNPQDLGTIRSKLISGYYISPTPVINDIRTVFSNAMIYNPPQHPINQLANKMSKIFEYELKRIVVRLKTNDKQLTEHSCELCEGKICFLCGDKCLKYCPPVIYCDGPCMQRILRNSYYYTVTGKKGRWCVKCQPKMLHGLTKEERKTKLMKHKNDQIEGEPWIQCSHCKRWLHQICGLFNKKCQFNKPYVCPVCRLNQPETRLLDEKYGNASTIYYNEWKGALELPETPLSKIIEKAVKNRIIIEYKKNNKKDLSTDNKEATEQQIQSVLDSIAIRVVSNKDETIDIIQPLQMYYGGSNSNVKDNNNNKKKVELKGKCKVILLFQRCSGIDILLFALYAREYDSTIPKPNTNCIYISYLDSIHFLKPPFLRTPIYHTILTSYIGYTRSLGYTSCRIWTCPPTRGDDYIFYDHPKEQRTPTPQRLLQWYKSMLDECVTEGNVYSITTQYEMMKESLFWKEPINNDRTPSMTSSLNNSLVSSIMRVLPYFDGDYWPVVVSQIASDMKENRPYCKPKKIIRKPTNNNNISKNKNNNNNNTSGKSKMNSKVNEIDDDDDDDEENDELYDGSESTTSSKNNNNNNNQIDSCFNNLPILIKKFIERMLPQKDRFIVAHLVPYCRCCGVYINNGFIYKCHACDNNKIHYDICEDCFTHHYYKHQHHSNAFIKSELRIVNTNTTNTSVLSPTLQTLEDPEPFSSSPIIDNRHTFLRVCQGNHLQFDTHRHAVYSTLMILYLFSSKKSQLTVRTCDKCLLAMDGKRCYTCKTCNDFDLCDECYQEEGHEHQMELVDLNM